jgi:hypothetical protein
MKKTRANLSLSQYKSIDFGTIILTRKMKELHQILNREMIDLCKCLPESVQDRALQFLMEYNRISPGEPLNFFKKYYLPAWSVIYHLLSEKNQKDINEDLLTALRGQALAMFLHSFDDHLNDGDIPASHLTLLLRSAAWVRFNGCIEYFSAEKPETENIAKDLIGDYYAGMLSEGRVDDLDGYCSLFKKQMATGLVMPVCIAKSLAIDDSVTELVRKSYEAFCVAWRLLDDINDIEEDILDGRRAAPYCALPADQRALWDIKNKKERLEKITTILIKEEIPQKIIRRIKSEMTGAEAYARRAGLPALADEYSCLRRPVESVLEK